MLAGVLAGAFATAAQSVRVNPLILEAEKYEGGGHSHAPAEHAHEATDTGETADTAKTTENTEHSHDAAASEEAETWAPEDGVERVFFTLVSNILVGVAFSLILTAAILLARQQISLQSGLVWGLAGFVVFVLAPNFGLSPELPGMPAAELGERQTWWLATVVATAGGLGLFAFSKKIPLLIAGALLIAAPHVYGAPLPGSHESAVPAGLAAEFAVATIVTSGLFWLLLGGVLGNFLQRALLVEAKDTATA